MNSRFLLALVVVLTSFSFLNAQPSRIMKSLESLEVEIGSQLSVQEIDEVNKSLSTRLKRRQSTIAVKKSISGFFASLFTLGASVAVIDYALGDYMLMTKQFIDWSYLELLTKNVSSSGFLIDGYTAYSAAKYFQEVGTVFDERTAAKLLKKIKTSEELVVKELKKEFLKKDMLLVDYQNSLNGNILHKGWHWLRGKEHNIKLEVLKLSGGPVIDLILTPKLTYASSSKKEITGLKFVAKLDYNRSQLLSIKNKVGFYYYAYSILNSIEQMNGCNFIYRSIE